MELYGLKTNYQVEPVGIALEGLTLSWKVREAKGSFQQAVRVRIAEDDAMEKVCYDSGRMQTRSCMLTPDACLEPGKRYCWQVEVEDDAGDTAVGYSWFEGGHPCGGWHGEWIRAPFSPEIAPLFHKTFTLTKEECTQRARLYICGLGMYELSVNGKKAGDEYLTPYYTDYRYRIQYQTYDISQLLREGENRVDVLMGNGWYKGKFGYTNKGMLCNYYGSEFKLLLDLWLDGEEGLRCVLGTDESWLALKSPVVASGIYDGEIYDARMEDAAAVPPLRQQIKAHPAQAPAGELTAMMGCPVRRRECLEVQQVITTDIGETVLDFGQEITGWVSFTVEAPADQRVLLQYGEVLQNGRFYRDNLRTARAEYLYISNGTRQSVRPHFTFYGFRYVKVTGMKVDASNVKDFQAWALYSDMEETGYLETSDKKINRLIANTKWSQKDNFLDIPTDCPQRDERLGWTGDAQIFSRTASYHMQTAAFFRKYLQDMCLEQKEKDGAVPYVVPDILTLAREQNAEPPFDITEDLWGEAGASVWGDAATIIPWNQYLFYGNPVLLAEQYENMKRWVDFMIAMEEKHCGGQRLWTCGFHFGDWLSLDSEGDSTEGGTDKHLVASVYYMYSAGLTSKAARILGKEEEASFYGQRAAQVREAVRRKYVTAPGTLSVCTQTAYVLGIYFRLFEDTEMEAAAQHLKALLEENKDHLTTGFVGTGYLCQALCLAGLTDKAYTLLLNEDYPGWLYQVNLGATTIWERWNSLLPDGSISSTGMNSLNHYAYGAIAGWLYEDACGLKPSEEHPGFAGAVFAPRPDRRLAYIRMKYESMYGAYEAGWKWTEEGTLLCTLKIPFNCEVKVCLNEGAGRVKVNKTQRQLAFGESLTCGTYELEVWMPPAQ